MCVARHVWSAQNNSHAVFFQYLRTELSYIVDILHADKGESFLQVDSIIFDGFDQACPNYLGKFVISLWNIKKEVRNEVWDLIALAGLNATLTIYYTSHVLPPSTLFLTQCGIHTKIFFIWIIVSVT